MKTMCDLLQQKVPLDPPNMLKWYKYRSDIKKQTNQVKWFYDAIVLSVVS